VLRLVTPAVVKRQRDGTLLLTARVSTSSQAHVNADVLATSGPRPWILKRGSRLAVPLGAGTTRRAQALILQSGAFPLRLRVSSRGLASRSVVRIRLGAIDPWGRTGARTLSFRVP
jgi:hypothetical protein